MTQPTNLLAQAGIFTREQLTQELGITEETLARWEEQDAFPSRKVGRTHLYDVEAIRRWITRKPNKGDVE